jgi:hypothetical protein
MKGANLMARVETKQSKTASASNANADPSQSLQTFELIDLQQYTLEKTYSPAAGKQFHLFFVGRDNVHDVLKHVLSRTRVSLYLNMFGYDDDELNQILMDKVLDPNVTMLITLDKSQAGGKHEKMLGAHEQRWRHFKAERLGGFEVDDQFEFGRRLNWQIGWLSAAQDAIDVGCGTPVLVLEIDTVEGKPTLVDGPTSRINCRKLMAGGEIDDIGCHHQTAIWLARECSDASLNVSGAIDGNCGAFDAQRSGCTLHRPVEVLTDRLRRVCEYHRNARNMRGQLPEGLDPFRGGDELVSGEAGEIPLWLSEVCNKTHDDWVGEIDKHHRDRLLPAALREMPGAYQQRRCLVGSEQAPPQKLSPDRYLLRARGSQSRKAASCPCSRGSFSASADKKTIRRARSRCARATSGHAAALPSPAMNARLFIRTSPSEINRAGTSY